MTHLDHNRKNGENRRSGDQERMVGGVFKESIHCSRSGFNPWGWQKGAKYNSRAAPPKLPGQQDLDFA